MNSIILKHFLDSNLKIISIKNLKIYIDFCIKNDKKIKKKNETSLHHILPQSKKLPFQKYKDLKENKWNGTHLTYYNHYKAHYLLTLSIEHFSIYYSFNLMNKQDVSNGR